MEWRQRVFGTTVFNERSIRTTAVAFRKLKRTNDSRKTTSLRVPPRGLFIRVSVYGPGACREAKTVCFPLENAKAYTRVRARVCVCVLSCSTAIKNDDTFIRGGGGVWVTEGRRHGGEYIYKLFRTLFRPTGHDAAGDDDGRPRGGE